MKTTFLKALVFVLGFTAVFSSCDKNEEVLNAQNTEQKQVINPLTAAEGTATSELRSTSTYANGEEAYPSEGEKGTNFFFKFRGAPIDMFNQVTMQIRFHAPNGGTYTFDMDPVGEENGEAIFEFERELSQTGTYRFEYGYSLRGSSFTPFNETFFVKVISGELDPISLENDYPHKNTTAGKNDGKSYITKNCTSYVAWKVSQLWGEDFYQGFSDAYFWKDLLTKKGYIADRKPKVGDIAWWKDLSGKRNPKKGNPYGHVAFVNKVENDGISITLTEYNYKKHQYGHREVSPSDGKRYPDLFIHVQQKID